MNAVHPFLAGLVDIIVARISGLLGSNLVGIYLHGSAVMGRFNPAHSDLDLLVVVHEPLTRTTKELLGQECLRLTAQAPRKGLELSVVLRRYTLDFVFPTPFEFHYSPAWQQAYESGTALLTMPETDPDLAAHFTVTQQRGVCLYGAPVSSVFHEVPKEFYTQSLMSDAEGILNDMTSDPIYSVLNLCRILAYQREGAILSKHEGGLWGVRELEPRLHGLIQTALQQYESVAAVKVNWDEQEINAFGQHMRGLLDMMIP